MDEQPHDPIVPMIRLRETDRAAHRPRDPGPQMKVCAHNFLGVVLANPWLFGVDMPLASAPPICVIARHATRLQQYLLLEKHGILSALEDVGYHVAAVMINRVPQPPRVRFAARLTPPFVQL
jgi:hypothetical protein